MLTKVFTAIFAEPSLRENGKMTSRRATVKKSGQTMPYTRASTALGRNTERVSSNGLTIPATRASSKTIISRGTGSIAGETAGSSRGRYVFA